MTQDGDPAGPDRGTPAQTAGNSLGLSEDLFGNTVNCPDTTTDPSDHTHQESVTLSVITAGIAQRNSPTGEIEDLEFDFCPCHSRDNEDSDASEPMPTAPGISIYQVTATDPQDFHDEEWGAMEFADERPYEDYDEGISEDGEEAGLGSELDETDFHQGD